MQNYGYVIRSNRRAGCNVVLKDVGSAVREYYVWASLCSTRKKCREVGTQVCEALVSEKIVELCTVYVSGVVVECGVFRVKVCH